MQPSLEQISAQPGFRSTYQVTQSGELALLAKTKRSSLHFSLAQQFFSPSYHFPQIVQQDSSLELVPKELGVQVAVACRCKKSRCLKNYCDCYNAGTACGAECGCLGCQNVHTNLRRERNALAKMGCQCSKSGCRKRYCACHSVGRKCAWYCRCANCENMGEGGSQAREMGDFEVFDEAMIKEEDIENELLFIQAKPPKRQRSKPSHNDY